MTDGTRSLALPEVLTWPLGEAVGALEALARRARLPILDGQGPRFDLERPLDGGPQEELERRIAGQAGRLGLEVEAVEASCGDLERTLSACGPALVRVPGGRLLAVVRCRRRRLKVVAPDLRLRGVDVAEAAGALIGAVAAAAVLDVDRLLERAAVDGRREKRARAALLSERLRGVRLAGFWLLRLPPGGSFWRQARAAGLHRDLLGFVGAYALAYGLLLASWWVLGATVLAGRPSRAGLLAWALLLLSAIPFRAAMTWCMAKLTVGGGALLKRRLLAGIFRLRPEEIRHQGVGQLLGRVLESETFESLGAHGAFLTLVGLIEVALSAVVLAAGAGGGRQAGLLAAWLLVALALGAAYLRRRRAWTERRIHLTRDLVEKLVGHRTRLLQERDEHRHLEEDRLLDLYLRESQRFDRTKARLVAVVPHGWLAVGVLGLLPSFLGGGLGGATSPALLALGVGGILAAFRGFDKCAGGFAHLSIALMSWRQAAVLFHAAGRAETAADPVVRAATSSAAPGPALEALDLVFRYGERARPVLDGCQLAVARGDRVLLGGASGCGKSTLAAVLAGLRAPDAGLVLLGGLDLHSLGGETWRRRVGLAPQFHENHVFTETFAFNLLLGRRWPPEEADLAEAEALCRELGLGGLLARMPSGLQQIVGETGWQLSHGERSRVYLARALLQGAEVVVLDESFAALDPENLDQALTCVLRWAPTLLVIAHP
jgi:ATP-binding cassette subfamily B protein